MGDNGRSHRGSFVTRRLGFNKSRMMSSSGVASVPCCCGRALCFRIKLNIDGNLDVVFWLLMSCAVVSLVIVGLFFVWQGLRCFPVIAECLLHHAGTSFAVGVFRRVF